MASWAPALGLGFHQYPDGGMPEVSNEGPHQRLRLRAGRGV
jgi:hypothetical protein